MYRTTGTTLIWSFRNRLDVLKKSILGAHETCPAHVDFQLVDAASNPATIQGLRTFLNGLTTGRVIRVCESTHRSSLSEAWNLGMMLTENRYVMFSSSDCVFKKAGWYGAIQEQLDAGKPYVLMPNHAVFGLDKSIIPKIGWFDEGFGIGPHFDPDYMIRASEAGISWTCVPNQGYYVHDEENKSYEKRITEHEADRLPMDSLENERYFISKWVSSWEGWDKFKGTKTDLPHPPTSISQVKRRLKEVDQHPSYTEKIRCSLLAK